METLSPQIIEIRDEIIEKLNGLTLEECSKKLKELFNQETNDFYKLGNLAARVITLKKRINLILNDSNEDNQNVLKNETKKSENMIEGILDGKLADTANQSDWVRVQVKETAEVNGVRFPAGIQIDVTNEDATRMIESGKAILLDHKEKSD